MTRRLPLALGARVARSLRQPRTLLSLALAALLLAGAFIAAARNREGLVEAQRAILAAPLWLALVTLLLPAATWLGTTGALLCVMRRYGKVGVGEMASLAGVAALVNYLPGRPGMIARIAYHKRVNAIRLRDSAKGVAWMTGLGAIALAALLGVALALSRLEDVGAGLIAAISFTPTALALLVGAILRWTGAASRDRRRDLLAFALAFRTIEMLSWSARYWAIFTLVGRPVAWESAVALATISNLAMAVPISGNGLGLREWAVGLLAPVLPGALAQSKGGFAAAEMGLLAEMIHRGVEVLVALPVGLLCAVALARRQRRRRQTCAARSSAA